eukprot:13131064-Heterocapsa_arctica.AAC.1
MRLVINLEDQDRVDPGPEEPAGVDPSLGADVFPTPTQTPDVARDEWWWKIYRSAHGCGNGACSSSRRGCNRTGERRR